MSPKFFKLFAIVMILIMLFVLAGCGGSPAAPSGVSITTSVPSGGTTNPAGGTAAPTANVAPAGVDPCTLLTRADAESILGKSVGEGSHPITASASYEVTSCEYKIVNGTPLDNTTLIYTYASSGDTSLAKTAFDTGRNSAQKSWNAAPVDVPGLGDEAYWVGGAGNNISILKGAVYITLSASTNKGDTPPAAILALAKVVLGRLP
jgi:hypothetical protein